MQDFYAAGDGSSGSFEAFLTAPPPQGPGLTDAPGTSQSGKLAAFFRSVSPLPPATPAALQASADTNHAQCAGKSEIEKGVLAFVQVGVDSHLRRGRDPLHGLSADSISKYNNLSLRNMDPATRAAYVSAREAHGLLGAVEPAPLAAAASLAELGIDAGALESLQGQLDSRGEMQEADQIHIQLNMDKYQQASTMLSNLLKKISETSSQIIGNMK